MIRLAGSADESPLFVVGPRNMGSREAIFRECVALEGGGIPDWAFLADGDGAAGPDSPIRMAAILAMVLAKFPNEDLRPG